MSLTRFRGGGGLTGAGGMTWNPFKADDNEYADTVVEKYLASQLHIPIKKKRDGALIKAMEKPSEWLTERNKEMDKIINGPVTTFFKEKLDLYILEGFPVEEAMSMAAQRANFVLQTEMEELELRYPGSNTIFASAAHKMADREGNFMLANGGAEQSINKKAIYKEYRQKKKAKRAKKASKQTSQ